MVVEANSQPFSCALCPYNFIWTTTHTVMNDQGGTVNTISSDLVSLVLSPVKPQNDIVQDEQQNPNRIPTAIDDRIHRGAHGGSPPRQYTIDRIHMHIYNLRQQKNCVRWYEYTLQDDTIKPP